MLQQYVLFHVDKEITRLLNGEKDALYSLLDFARVATATNLFFDFHMRFDM